MKILYQSVRSILVLGCLLSGITAMAQSRTISGQVISEEDGGPLSGVTIQVVGTTTGAISDIEGNYSFQISEPSTKLSFSYIGFQTQIITVTSQTTVNVTMVVDAEQLDEVVVTALGIKKETKSLGYSVTEFNGDNMVKAREANPVSTLTGKVAGLSIRTPTDFFQDPVIEMRGGTPLVVIDGVPNPNADFWEISPDDIDNISVLKGATASALYGSIGRDGALLITTKRGRINLRWK
ncbi:MAG: carboxypeptidase-like regulatory domain-containing protein [Ekhidna sp.]|nr:carboxypeptidase-like regulatory domain-containing protein [Ekhidna sp.]